MGVIRCPLISFGAGPVKKVVSTSVLRSLKVRRLLPSVRSL